MTGSPSRFSAPTRIVAGLGCLSVLPGELSSLGARPIAVIADRGVADAGLLDVVLSHARRSNAVTVGLIDPDPDVDAAEEAAARAEAESCETVMMIGGGSALSVGKAVALRLTNDKRIDLYEGRDRARLRPAPSVAIPTTAGSGSEVSNALVLHDAGRGRLVVVRGHGYEPDVALLDAHLLASLPAAPMLFAALDALSHAFEALWTHASSATTDALALAAVQRIRTTLPRAMAGRDPIDLQRLLEASAMANLACGSAGLGLVHALSSATTVRVPHGLQNGILLPAVARFNRPVLSPEVLAEVAHLEQLYADLGFEPRFDQSQLPLDAGSAMVAAAAGNPFRENNRRRSSEKQLRELIISTGIVQ